LGVAIALLVGCGRAPEPLIKQAAEAVPPIEITEESAGRDNLLAETPAPANVEASAPGSPVAQFKNPQTQAAVEDYQSKWQALQDDAQAGAHLDAIDPLVNPQALTDYANRIGTHANQLDQAERAAKDFMSSQEKKRFKSLQKELQEEHED
jgi:hypothetical protein